MPSPASLDNCSHQFCFECIKHWGTSCANTCPLCKKRFNVIKYTENGKQVEHKVLNRNQGYTGNDNAILV